MVREEQPDSATDPGLDRLEFHLLCGLLCSLLSEGREEKEREGGGGRELLGSLGERQGEDQGKHRYVVSVL